MKSCVQPFQVSCLPMQIAWMCRHPELHTFDLSSVYIMNMGGSCSFPQHEREIFNRIPNLRVLSSVSYHLTFR